jgi:cysteine desulfurase
MPFMSSGKSEHVRKPENIAYLDNNASTQCAPEVIEAMLPFFEGCHGNPSSPHLLGRQAARAVTAAREHIAECIDCDPAAIFFTSGATEANNLVILGLTHEDKKRRRIVTSIVEHKSVLGPCESLAEKGYEIATIPVTRGGIIDVDAARSLIDDRTMLVSVQGANNEIGTLQPVKDLATIAHEKGAALHCDAAQLLGKVPVSLSDIGADFVSFSSHKAYGPKGIGFLAVKTHVRGVSLSPIYRGGGQENGFRPGTLNVPGIVGTGEACRLSRLLLVDDMHRIRGLRQLLEDAFHDLVPESVVLAASSQRLPGTTSIMFPGIPSDLLIARTPTVCMSTGSACTSGSVSPSHVLLALELSRDAARSVVRLSLGRYNSAGEVQAAVEAVSHAVRETDCNCCAAD